MTRSSYRASESRSCSAVFTHTYGRGSSFQRAIQASRSRSTARTELWVSRPIFFMGSSPNQRSTMFSHEELVGMKWRWKRGWRISHRSIAGVSWVASLSRIRGTSRWSGTSVSIRSRNFSNSVARWRAWGEPITLPGVMSRAANELVVPWRR